MMTRHRPYLDRLAYACDDGQGNTEWQPLPEETDRLCKAAPLLLEACRLAAIVLAENCSNLGRTAFAVGLIEAALIKTDAR